MIEAVNITDTSGDIELSEVGPSTIVDQAGALLLKNINGDLEISDEAGEVRVAGVTGNGAGNITAREVANNVSGRSSRADRGW